MRNNSVWGANDTRQDNQPQDLVQLLRSPLFYAAAVVVVVVWMVVSALSNENWMDVGPIPVVQEQRVVYLEEEGIFVFWNDGDPYGVLETTEEGDVAVYCRDAETFASADGQAFDLRGRASTEGEGLTVLPTRMDGHRVFVNGDASEGERASGQAEPTAGCDPPTANARGILDD